MKHQSFKIIYSFSLCCLSLCCSSPVNQRTSAAKIDSTLSKETTINKLSKDSLGLNFNNQKPFKILSFRVIPVRTSFFTDSLECKNWSLSLQAFTEIINNSKPISGTEQDLAFANHSCGILAQVEQENQNFEIQLNAGSWMYVRCRDTTLIFGDFNKADEKYFLSTPNTK